MQGLDLKRFSPFCCSIAQEKVYLGFTKGTLYVWVCQRRIPYLKIGKLVKFDIIEVENWLKEKRVKVF